MWAFILDFAFRMLIGWADKLRSHGQNNSKYLMALKELLGLSNKGLKLNNSNVHGAQVNMELSIGTGI